MANELYLDVDTIMSAARDLGVYSGEVSDAQSNATKDFSGASNAGLTANTMNDISNNMTELADMTSEMQTIMINGVEGLVNVNQDIVDELNDMEIPTDFLANNAMEINKYNTILLSKIDGKAIKDENEAKESEYDGTSEVEVAALKDITGETAKEEKYDESTVIGKSILANVKGDNTEGQSYDGKTTVSNQKLSNINNNVTEQQKYDESTNVNGEQLKNISGNETQEQKYDESTNISTEQLRNISGNQTQEQRLDEKMSTKEEQLQNIRNNITEQQEYDGNVVIGESILGNINDRGKEEKQKEVDVDQIIAEKKKQENEEIINKIPNEG